MAIMATDLSFGYDKELILENGSFLIEQGEYIGVFGPNGGGKTSLLKLLAGLLKPVSGKIEILGREPRFSKGKIGYLPQNSSFDADFPISVLEIVLMGALLPNIFRSYLPSAQEKAREALKKVGLLSLQSASLATLSGGQRQRVLIARALVSEPSILLLDEPTANTDSVATEEIYAVLRNLKGSVTIIMVSHDLENMIDNVDRYLYVHKNISAHSQEEICSHFIDGLYHVPFSHKTK